jgi:eukaryotic-like serine/threonine-protein kinase
LLDGTLFLSTSLAAVLLGMAAAALYVYAIVPRLPAAPWVSAGLLTLLLGAGFAAPSATALGLWAAGTALVLAHAAWWWGWHAGLKSVNAKPKARKARAAFAPGSSNNELRLRDIPPAETVPMTFADTAAPGLPTDLPAPALQRPDRTQLGRYRIERQIGRGSMGAVYAGMDPKAGRAVALKTLALSREFEGAELADARARFFREAETAGRLKHRDIVTIYDAGEEHGLAYIAMEYLSGSDLQTHTQPGRLLPVAAVLRCMARVALALHYAHSQGVVHRDIKPANVMVDLAADSVKVTDFGIARIAADASRTRTGLVLGSPSFMSPEQMAGQRVDGRSDLYSLGAMLFQLLTGRLPHQADTMSKLMFQIANEPAPDVRTLRPEIPELLAQIVARAMEKRPEGRFSDGQELAAALQRAEALVLQSGLDMGRHNPILAPPIAPPPGFEATLALERPDPGHNSPP